MKSYHQRSPPFLRVQTQEGILQRRYFLLNAVVWRFQTTSPQLRGQVIHFANAMLLSLREDGLKGFCPLIVDV
jgi:hypothetical protein